MNMTLMYIFFVFYSISNVFDDCNFQNFDIVKIPHQNRDLVQLRLEPGLAFGSGSHPTTRMCLQWLAEYVQPGQRVLDFGCGFGRNTFYLASENKKWTVVGYDNDAMLHKTQEYSDLHYPDTQFDNIQFNSDWNQIKTQTFDWIICWLVLQHIYVKDLKVYLKE